MINIPAAATIEKKEHWDGEQKYATSKHCAKSNTKRGKQ